MAKKEENTIKKEYETEKKPDNRKQAVIKRWRTY